MKLNNALTKTVAAFLLGASVVGIGRTYQSLTSDVILTVDMVLSLGYVGLNSIIVMLLSVIFLTPDVEVEVTKE